MHPKLHLAKDYGRMARVITPHFPQNVPRDVERLQDYLLFDCLKFDIYTWRFFINEFDMESAPTVIIEEKVRIAQDFEIIRQFVHFFNQARLLEVNKSK